MCRSAGRHEHDPVAVNLDPVNMQAGFVELNLAELNLLSDATFQVEDLFTGAVYHWSGVAKLRLAFAGRDGAYLACREIAVGSFNAVRVGTP
jgi:hypothetical protein